MSVPPCAFIVGMSDEVRGELIGLLEQSGYDVTQPALHPSRGGTDGEDGRDCGMVLIDPADGTHEAAIEEGAAREDTPATTVVLISENASVALPIGALPEGAWALVRKDTSTKSILDLIAFLTGTTHAIH